MTPFTSLCFRCIIALALSITPAIAGRSIEAVRSSQPVKVDGVLSEAVWQRPGAGEFLQFDPQPGTPATEQSEVWVAYDDDAIYIAARLYDSTPSLIARNYGRRDAGFESDWFWVGTVT